ncbi:MAG: hypothetical protein M1272_07590 [Firmicutes bacterium]|nr:hypothetical protein [Bacillota bacterium]
MKEARATGRAWIKKGLNRGILLVLYGAAVFLSLRLSAPFHGPQRDVWIGLGMLLLLTSATDVLFSRLFRILPITAGVVGLLYWVKQNQFTQAMLVSHSAWLIGLLGATWGLLRATRHTWAAGDWWVAGVMVFFAPHLAAAAWLAGTLILLTLYRWGTALLKLPLNTLPLLPFAFFSFIGVTIGYSVIR